MATQLSGELDMASSVRAVSSWSRVASMDSNQKTTSTCERQGIGSGWEPRPAHLAQPDGSLATHGEVLRPQPRRTACSPDHRYRAFS